MKREGAPSVANLKIFIILCLISYFYTHLYPTSQRSWFIQFAQAGSKSSKASSKTTVIAIDGGGGGAKPHPMPVPWPVVHCHHHHHHLKYVPKPVLVHHWVKKLKPYEIAASEHFPIDMHGEHHQQPHSPVQFQPQYQHQHQPQHQQHHHQYPNHGSIGKDMNEESPFELSGGGKIPPEIGNILESVGAIPSGSQQMNTAMKFPPPTLVKLNQRQPQSKQLYTSKPIHLRQIDKIAQTILSNAQKRPGKPSVDSDSDDSLKNIALANITDNFNLGNQTFPQVGLNGEPNIPDYIGEESNSIIEPLTGSNMGNEFNDQSVNELNFLSQLNDANLREENAAAKILERLALEQTGRMQTLASLNQPIMVRPGPVLPVVRPNQFPPQTPSRNFMQNSMQLPNIMNPAISARVANFMSESHTIDFMTKLAGQIAQMEAKKLINQQTSAATAQSNASSAMVGQQKKTFLAPNNLLSKLGSQLKGQLEKRKSSAPIPTLYNFNLQPARYIAQWPRVSTLVDPQSALTGPVTNLQSDYYNRPSLPSLYDLPAQMSQPAPTLMDPMFPEASNHVNKVVDPSMSRIVATTTASKLPSRAQSETSKQADMSQSRPIKNQKKLRGSNSEQAKQKSEDTNLTLDADQEHKFYEGQKDHLIRVKHERQAAANKIQSLEQSHGANSRANTTRKYNSQSSNVHNSIAEPSSQLSNSDTKLAHQDATGIDKQTIQSSLQPSKDDIEQLGNQAGNLFHQGRYDPSKLTMQLPHQSLMNLPSYLEFPLTPEQWSNAALESMNKGQQKDGGLSDDQGNGEKSAQSAPTTTTAEDPNQQVYEIIGGNSASGPKTITLAQLIASQQQTGSGASMFNPGAQHSFSSPEFSPYSMMGSMGGSIGSSPAQSLQSIHMSPSAQLQLMSNLSPDHGFGQMAGGAALSSMLMSPSSGSYGSRPAQKDLATMAALRGYTKATTDGTAVLNNYPRKPGASFDLADQANGLSAAHQDMNQLTQLHSGISQSVSQANNLTGMARLSRQLRNQMQTLQGRRPSMPNIPNVPQPPQIPNLPMPPPGMMQMAGLALPFAMARANRIRNQQVNAAANGGGVSTGQRLLSNAARVTNRFMRPRRRPTTSPSGTRPSNNGNRVSRLPNGHRNRFMGVIQAVVDMSRRPVKPSISTSSAAGSKLTTIGAPKIKPKSDEIAGLKSKRMSRALAGHFENQDLNRKSMNASMILMGSLPTTANDGRLVNYASMTSPVDNFAQQLLQRKLRSMHQKSYLPLSYSVGGKGALNEHLPLSNEPRLSSSNMMEEEHQTFPSTRNADKTNPFVHLPYVANHINLLLVSAQNVTTHQPKPTESSMTDALIGEQPRQEHQQQELQTQEPHVQEPQAQEPQQQYAQVQPDVPSAADNSEQAGRDQMRLQEQDQQAQIQEALQVQQQNQQVEDQQQNQQQQTDMSKMSPSATDEYMPSQSIFESEQSSFRPVAVPRVTSTTLAPLKSTTTTTEPPTSTKAPLSSSATNRPNKWQPKPTKKSKRSTRPPTTEIPAAHEAPIPTSTKPKPTSSPALALALALAAEVPTGEVIQEGPVEEVSASREESKSIRQARDVASEDYVRAIKLIRGVAYPWPPPTKASVLLPKSTRLMDTTLFALEESR